VDERKSLVTGHCCLQGRAVQVNPVKPTWKAPGTVRLKLNCD